MRFLIFIFLMSCSGTIEYGAESNEEKIPVNLSWANIDLNKDGVTENYVTSIKNQGPCGSCTFHAAVGLVEIQYSIEHNNEMVNLSEQNIQNCLRIPCHSGYWVRENLSFIREYGVVEERYVPQNTWGTCLNCEQYSKYYNISVSNIPFYRISKVNTLFYYFDKISHERRKEMLVEELQHGPVAFVVSHWGSTIKKKGDLFYCTADRQGGGHALVMVGYENNGDIFLVKNSHNDNQLLRFSWGLSAGCGFGYEAFSIRGVYKENGAGKAWCGYSGDLDRDGHPDPVDNCPTTYNPNQQNVDDDLMGDVCDVCMTDPNPYCGV